MSRETIETWRKLIFRPSNACLCITGPLTKGMEAAAIAIFSNLTEDPTLPAFEQTVPVDFCNRDAGADRIMTEEGSHASVHLAFDIDPEQVFPIIDDVVNSITAGGTDSLLFQKLREEEALVADIHSYIEQTGIYRRLVIRWDVRQSVLSRSLREVFSLLRRLCIYVRPVRMELSRMQFTDNLILVRDDPAEMTELMGWAWIEDDMGRCDLTAQARMYNDLTVDDLQNTAQSIFRNANLVASVCYDPEGCPDDPAAILREVRAMLD